MESVMKQKPHHPTSVMLWSLASFILLVFVSFAYFSHPTWALYSSDALAGNNQLRGGSVEIGVLGAADNPESPARVAPGEEVSHTSSVNNNGQNPLRYQALLVTTGDDELCAAMQVVAIRAGDEVFSGLLASVPLLVGSLLEPDADESWEFRFSLPSDFVSNDTAAVCIVSFRFPAWQGELVAPGVGWSDEALLPDFTLALAEANAQPEAKSGPTPPSLVADPLKPPLPAQGLGGDETPPVVPPESPTILETTEASVGPVDVVTPLGTTPSE